MAERATNAFARLLFAYSCWRHLLLQGQATGADITKTPTPFRHNKHTHTLWQEPRYGLGSGRVSGVPELSASESFESASVSEASFLIGQSGHSEESVEGEACDDVCGRWSGSGGVGREEWGEQGGGEGESRSGGCAWQSEGSVGSSIFSFHDDLLGMSDREEEDSEVEEEEDRERREGGEHYIQGGASLGWVGLSDPEGEDSGVQEEAWLR